MNFTKRMKLYYFRNALDEEQRAQKALYLLQARDRRIALLEKRVAELEDAATNLHELTLRNSSRGSILELDSVASGKARSCKSECDFDVDSTGRGGIREDLRRGGGGEEEDRCEPSSMMNGRVSIPCLDLSKSSESASDIFSTAIDFVMEKSKCFPSNTSFSVEEEGTERDELNENLGNRVAESRSETKLGASSGNVVGRREDEEGVGNRGESKNKDCMGWRSEEKVRAASICNKYQRSNFPRLTSSVPWIRAKHKSFRKKLRGYELKAGKRIKDASYGDGHLAFAAFQ